MNNLSTDDIGILRDWLEEDVNQVPLHVQLPALRRLESWGMAEHDKRGGGWSRTAAGSGFLAALTGEAGK